MGESGAAHPNGLTTAQRRALAALVALAARGAVGALAARAEACREAGVPAGALREALLQLVPYVGFPRTLSALGALAAAGQLPAAPAGVAPDLAEAQRAPAGRAAFEAVYGETAARVRAGLAGLDPLLPAWTEEFAYGRVIARPQLALAEREVLAVAVLAALGGLGDPLLGHLRGAARLGVGRDELAALLAGLPPEVPEAARSEALALLARL